MRGNIKVLCVSVLLAVIVTVQGKAQDRVDATNLWNEVVSEHVSNNGSVDYKSIKSDARFSKCIELFESSVIDSKMSSDAKKAFWMNVYNAFTVKLIVDNYPIASITNLNSPWKNEFINIEGNKYSLNQIENEILRVQFSDARIHFGINCASISCPKLWNRAFTEKNTERALDELTSRFINDKNENELLTNRIKVSHIFEWYAEDFVKEGGVAVFVEKYSTMKVNANASVTYMEYNWNLNGK